MKVKYVWNLIILFEIILLTNCFGQQIPDNNYSPPFFVPKYERNIGTEIIIDEAHNNFHTADGRFLPFTRILKNDGYKISRGTTLFEVEALKSIKILVISNALNNDNLQQWNLPTPSAFNNEEIKNINNWVKSGGSLFLIADHMPFAGAAKDLAASFGFQFYNGFAFDTTQNSKPDLFCRADSNLIDCQITGKLSNIEIDSIYTFTGQAFDIPNGAVSIITLNNKFKIFLCNQAWSFDSTTLKIKGLDKSQGAYLQYGKGKVVVFGEAAMFTAQLTNGKKVGLNSEYAKNNYKLLLNIIHWLDE